MSERYVVQMSKEGGAPYQVLDKTSRQMVSNEVTAREAAVAAEAAAREAAVAAEAAARGSAITELKGKSITKSDTPIITASNIAAPYNDMDTFPDNTFVIYSGTRPSHSPNLSSNRFTAISYNAYNNIGFGSTQIIVGEYETFSRTSNSGTWTEWQALRTRTDVHGADLGIITSSNIVAPYDDLNTFPDNRFAYYAQNSIVSHTPELTNNEGFTIISYNPGTSGVGSGTTQILISKYEGYVRKSASNVWDDWKAIYNSKEPIVGSYKRIVLNNTMTAPYDDLDTIPENEFILYAGATPDHVPSSIGTNTFTVISYNSYLTGKGTTQILISARELYTRICADNVWAEWVNVTKQNALHSAVKTILSKPLNITPSSTFLFSGDSITAETSSQRGDPWVDYVMTHFNIPTANYKNIAVPGADYGYNGSYIIDQLEGELSVKNDYDFLYIAAGVNDYRGNVSLSDFRTALNAVSTYLSEHYSGHVIIQTPIQSPENNPNAKARTNKLIDYSDVLFTWAMENGYDCINGFDLGFAYEPADYVGNIFASDLLHPNDLGMAIYARGVENAIG